MENAAGRFQREWNSIKDDRKERGLDEQSEERKSRLFVGEVTDNVDRSFRTLMLGETAKFEPTDFRLKLNVEIGNLEKSSNGLLSAVRLGFDPADGMVDRNSYIDEDNANTYTELWEIMENPSDDEIASQIKVGTFAASKIVGDATFNEFSTMFLDTYGVVIANRGWFYVYNIGRETVLQ